MLPSLHSDLPDRLFRLSGGSDTRPSDREQDCFIGTYEHMDNVHVCVHTCMCMYTWLCTYMHALVRVCAYTYNCTYVHAHANTGETQAKMPTAIF